MDFALLDALRREHPELPVFIEYPAEVYGYKMVAESMKCMTSDYAEIDGSMRLNSTDPNTTYAMKAELHQDAYLTWEECDAIVADKIRKADWKPCILVVLS